MQNQSTQNYNFYQYESYGARLLKGITRDLVFSQLMRFPLLMKYYKKNKAQIQSRIVDTLMRQPSGSDCPGFIYGFKDYNQHKLDPYSQKYEIKMGRTKKQVPQKRIYEWQHQDGHEYVQLFTIRSEHNIKLQSLVHLFFAYARRLKIINGKRRIEWFNFQENSLNAAVTAMINDLMEKVHQLGKINQTQPPTLSFDLEGFCKQLQEEILSVQFLKKRFVLTGLKESGKSVVKGILNGQILKSTLLQSSQTKNPYQQQLQYQIKLPTTIDLVQNIIQLNHLSTIHNSKQNPSLHKKQMIQLLRRSFYLWTNLNSVTQLAIPCLVVTESDVLSSQMVGFREAFRNLLKYIKISQGLDEYQESSENEKAMRIKKKVSQFSLFLIVTKIQKEHKYSESRFKQYILSQGQYFQEQQLQILLNCSIQFNHLADKQGLYQYEVQQFILKIQSHDFNRSREMSFQYSQHNQEITKICQEIIRFSYEELSLKFEDYFRLALRKIVAKFDAQSAYILQNSDRVDSQILQIQQALAVFALAQEKLRFFETLQVLVDQLKQTHRQKQVLLSLKKIQHMLQFSQSDKVFCQLQIFCECVMKSSSKFDIDLSVGQQGSQALSWQQHCSPRYLSNTLILCGLGDRMEVSRQQIREQVNHVIQNQLKTSFQRVVKQFYSSLDDKSAQGKAIFNQAYDILFRIMNIDQVVTSQRIEKGLAVQTVSNLILQEEILLKLIDEIIELSGGRGSKHGKQLSALIQLIGAVYAISRQHKLKTSNLISRLREGVFVATRGKRPVQMIQLDADHPENKNHHQKPSANKKNNNHHAPPASNQTLANAGVKIITNKKNEVKNQRLLNYINQKKRAIQLGNAQGIQMENNQDNSQNSIHMGNGHNTSQNSVQMDHIQDNSHNSISQGHPNSISQQVHPKAPVNKTAGPKKQVNQMSQVQYEQEFFQMPKGRQHSNGHKQMQNQMSSQEEYFSLPQEDSQDCDMKQIQTSQLDFKPMREWKKIQQLKKFQSNNKALSEVEQEGYQMFLSQLSRGEQQFAKISNYSNLASIQSFYNETLSNIEKEQRYNQIAFNFHGSTFNFDLPSITLHNAFVIIFAKKISFSHPQTQINFKIHYKNRKPTRVTLILVAQTFQGTQKLKIQQNKFGKTVMIESTKANPGKYKIKDGYFTKNKRNQKKLQQLRVNQLVQAYGRTVE